MSWLLVATRRELNPMVLHDSIGAARDTARGTVPAFPAPPRMDPAPLSTGPHRPAWPAHALAHINTHSRMDLPTPTHPETPMKPCEIILAIHTHLQKNDYMMPTYGYLIVLI